MTPLNNALSIASVKLHTRTELSPAGKGYLCFLINGKYSHAAQCVKYRIMNMATDSILYIYIFEQKCVVIKGMLQSPRLEDHKKTIGIDQSFRNRLYV